MFYREYTQEITKNCFTLRDEKDCVGSRGYTYRVNLRLRMKSSDIDIVLLDIRNIDACLWYRLSCSTHSSIQKNL